ncbi:hypothetical protein ACFQ7F_40635 [Streptomyces sp. NPDC056486]|uniref:hypothetical protein n=1 Tax=Streptomyces sp. NPDC056486 TaxID=3345835 RepID=UPI0036A62BC5
MIVTLHQVSADLRGRRPWPVTVLVMQADASTWESMVFNGLDDDVVEAVTAALSTVDVVARGRAAGAVCPDCRCFSDRVHSCIRGEVGR